MSCGCVDWCGVKKCISGRGDPVYIGVDLMMGDVIRYVLLVNS